jgi:uncharacterized protein (DUF58 family)
VLDAAYAAVLDQVRGITWSARRRTRSAMAGPHPSRILGTSAEFVEYRQYRQGDDPKRIDWKLLARTDRVYIRLSQERTLLPTAIVVDASGSLAFPTHSLAKWGLARHLAVALAAVARHSGDPVGLVVAHESGQRAVAPSARRSVLEEMMRALDVAPVGQPALVPAVTEALRRGARVVLISDFLDETEALLAAGRTFAAAGGELYALHIVDQGELNPDPKRLLVEDPEAPLMRRPMTPPTRAAYLERFSAWRAQLARDWRNAGAVYAVLVTGEEPLRRSVRRITTRLTAAR